MKKVAKFGCLSVVGLVVLIVIIAVATSGGGGEEVATSPDTVKDTPKEDVKAASDKETKEKADKAKTVGVGDPATIANVTFKVKSAETKKVLKPENDIMEPAKPSGKFIVLNVSIKNGQKEALNILSSYFKLKTADGTTYEPSTESDVMMAVPMDKQFFLEQINPGIKKSGIIVYDVPKDLKLSDLYVYCKTGFWGTETVKIQLGK